MKRLSPNMPKNLKPGFFVLRGKVVPGAAGSFLLSSGFVEPVAEPARVSVLANTTSEALAHGQPGTLTVHPVWASAT